MTVTTVSTALAASLRAMAGFIGTLTDAQLHRSQDGKWTIGQELAHIYLADSSTSRLLSDAGRAMWRPEARESRSFDAIKAGYLEQLARFPGANNPNTNPKPELESLTPAQWLENWQTMSAQLLAHVDAIPETDLDAYTVWKHPLLGPFTVREMIYFTGYHTQHHADIVSRKAM
ncbi:DinB family protein [Arsenicibacter rosenii]|uniref:DinB-like domain-containing protein n=1 Tax=Arsenicibacter rosenii TaxID=1750698 RepID=A0A1S2VS02_9BACT|nr:DinB family protein [Arsenicibacter rosenii]OIN60668.1 hypothetical protein BLX24_00700 [Arsenicibacter rosenii]